MGDTDAAERNIRELNARIMVLETAVRHLLKWVGMKDDIFIDRFMAAAHAEADGIEAGAAQMANHVATEKDTEFVRIMRNHISLSVD